MALYVKFAQEQRPNSVKGFLKKFYTREVTVDTARGHYTYLDPECKQVQDRHQYRSFDDLLELVQTYYPKVTPVKLMHYLLTTKIALQGKDRVARPHLGKCSDMGKIRFIPYMMDSYSEISTKMSKSKYTWSELMRPLGIKTEHDFVKYYSTRT
jgi:hypothetical protein